MKPIETKPAEHVVGQAVPPVWPSKARLCLLLSFFCLLLACNKSKNKEATAETEPPTNVQVEAVHLGAIDRVITTDAVLYPIDQSNVTPKISAPVKRILVKRGDHVHAGQLVAELESADLAAAANESQQQFNQAQSNLQTVTGATVPEDQTKAQSDVESARQSLEAAKNVYTNRVELVKQGALAQKLADDAKVAMVQAQSQFDTAQRHLQALNQVAQREQIRGAQAQADAAKAHYDSSAVQVSYAQIRTPISGIVSDRPVYPGEMAASGMPIISVVDISSVVARANVPVSEAAYIKIGRPATVELPDGNLAGKVTVVSPSVDPASTTVEVWVEIPNPAERLKPGGTVHVSINAETIQNTIIAPATALLNSDEGGQIVMVITKDNVAHEHKVNVGVRQGMNVQIVSGVQEGDQVVTVGGLGLEDKAKVKVQAAPAEDEDDDDDDK
jgi:multidrug efflux pump subunit AcrA (membrane-fusion protein)